MQFFFFYHLSDFYMHFLVSRGSIFQSNQLPSLQTPKP